MGWLGDGATEDRFARPERRWGCRRGTPVSGQGSRHVLTLFLSAMEQLLLINTSTTLSWQKYAAVINGVQPFYALSQHTTFICLVAYLQTKSLHSYSTVALVVPISTIVSGVVKRVINQNSLWNHYFIYAKITLSIFSVAKLTIAAKQFIIEEQP